MCAGEERIEPTDDGGVPAQALKHLKLMCFNRQDQNYTNLTWLIGENLMRTATAAQDPASCQTRHRLTWQRDKVTRPRQGSNDAKP